MTTIAFPPKSRWWKVSDHNEFRGAIALPASGGSSADLIKQADEAS